MHVYLVVAKENESLVTTKLHNPFWNIKQRLVIGESVILQLHPRTSSYWVDLETWLVDEGIAYNATEHRDRVSYWPDQVKVMRFDLAGDVHFMNSLSNEPEGVREALHHLITLDPNEPREKDRMFHAYLACIGFDDQERLSKLHRMRKLIGGL